MRKHLFSTFIFTLFLMLFFLLLTPIALTQETSNLALDKHELTLGDEVIITIITPSLDGLTLKITHGVDSYSYLGALERDITFSPSSTGEYVVRLFDGATQQLIDEETLTVTKKIVVDTSSVSNTQVKLSVTPPPGTVKPGTALTITVLGFSQEERLQILTPEGILRYNGPIPENAIGYVIPKSGEYAIQLLNKNRSLIDEARYIVTELGTTATTSTTIIPPITSTPTQQSSTSANQITGIDSPLRGPKGNARAATVRKDAKGVEIIPKSRSIRKLRIDNPSFNGQIGVDDLELRSLTIKGKPVTDAFAIDPRGEDIEVTFVATGTSLEKCAAWNFTARSCDGTWSTLIENLIPGREYTITVNGTDPAFAQTGLTTINTRRPVYGPNETVQSLIVVLDDEGSLVTNATITAFVTNPANITSLHTTGSDIVEIEAGVYAFNYTMTGIEGIYSLFVTADNGITMVNMSNYFRVNSTYDFDIYRHTPVTIDPFAELLDSSITITPRINVSSYNVTERLSNNFTFINATGATITTDGTDWYITWSNLTGIATVNYTAVAPQVSPDVEALGPLTIEFASGTYSEGRPWYLALDPVYLRDDAIGTSAGSVDQGSTVTITGNLFCYKSGGGEVPIDFSVWLEDDTVAIDTTTAGVDFSCAGSSAVTVTTCEATSCTVQSDCTVDVVGCEKNDDVDVEWVITAQGNNEALPSANTIAMDGDTGTFDDTTSVTINEVVDAQDPNVILNTPSASYLNDSDPPVSVTFNCSATDDIGLDTMQLWLTNSTNQSFSLNDTCSLTGLSDSCEWNKNLPYGNYTWNCWANDTSGNSAFNATNRTIRINGTIQTAPIVGLMTPENDTIDGDGSVFFECNATDNVDLVNITLYTNLSGGWTPSDTVNFTGGADTSGVANFTINGVGDGTFFHWNCLAVDSDDESAFASANFTVNVTYLPDQPNVTLSSPYNGTTEYLEPVTFTCNATDNNDIASINLYTNRTGPFSFEATQQFSGPSDSDVSANFDVSGFTDGQKIKWNCKAIDNNSNEVWAPKNWTLTVDFLQPNVTLVSPADYSYDLDGSMTLTCNATDNGDIVNVSLYHNIGGFWQYDQSQNYPGGSDTSVQPGFGVSGASAGTDFQWNCLVVDSDGFSSWAATNWTVTVPPNCTAYYAQDSGGSWTNPNRAEGSPDGLTANTDLDSALDLITYNFNGYPTAGTLLRSYLGMRWSVSTPPSNDDLRMQYSPDGGTNYYSLAGTLNGYTEPGSYPSSPTTTTYGITGSLATAQLSNLNLRVYGNQDSGPDNVNALIDSLWFCGYVSPPPQYIDYGKNETVIDEDENVTFWSTWEDDINLDCFIFSINLAGSWVNSSCIDLDGKSDNGSISWNVTAVPGTTVYWRFYANDTFGDTNVTPIQSFIVNDPNDNTPPFITNLSAVPTQAQALTEFNLSADAFDAIGVASTTVQVTRPSGTSTNVSMTRGTGNEWWALYTGLEGGTHTFKVWASDTNGNTNVSGYNESFNVTALVMANKQYYDRSETAYISGYGFGASATATFDIKDSGGSSQTGFPTSESTDATGNSSTTWGIPSWLSFPTGNYTVYGNDSFSADNDSFLVVVKPDSATKTDDLGGGDNVKALVNESDDNDARVVGDTAEVYVQLRYQGLIAAGYTLDELYLHVEHQDFDPESDTIDVQFWNGATWQAATCGSFAYRGTETFDVCDLTADIATLPDVNDVRIRLSDGNGGNDGVDFTRIDIAYLDPVFSITTNLAVTIEAPQNIENLYDYLGASSNTAYDGQTATVPPALTAQVTGTQASSAEYDALETSDNDWWKTIAISSGYNAYQTFYFSISEAESDVVKLTLTHEGYATQRTSLTADPYRVYLYDYTAGAWDLISADPITASASDQVIELEVTANIQDYIASDGEVNALIVGQYTLAGCGNPANCRADINTDFISLTVEQISTIDGFQDINVTAIDGDGVQSCTYQFSQGATAYTVYGLDNVTSILWHNVSDTTDYADGVYNITANCTDGTEINDSEYVTVRVLNQAPSVFLVAPGNNENFTVTSINFTWNASSTAGNPLCDLFIDGQENLSNIVSASGQNTTQQVDGLSDGHHNWSVRCNVAGGAYNMTSTWNFTVDTGGPVIVLNDPDDNDILNYTIITFTYTPTDTNGVENCSLYIDGAFNQSNASIQNGQPNYFTATLAEGDHNWSVSCTDGYGFTTGSAVYDFAVDETEPNIQLNYPQPDQLFLGGLVQFNYTASDNYDTSLLCNLTVDGVVIEADIPSPDGVSVIRNHEIGDGFKLWNVTCWDDAGNTNTSETRNFTVKGPPTVTLVFPDNDEWVNSTLVNFTYYVEDSDGIQNCSLYLDGAYNDIDFAVTNVSNNNFTKTLTEGTHNWTVECYDGDDKSTMADWWNFTVDATDPNITLYGPENDTTISSNPVKFNFTVTDNLDPMLTCNLTVNGVVSPANANFPAANGSLINRTQNMIGGDVYWNVTCWDDAGRTFTSETRYFYYGALATIDLETPQNDSQTQATAVLVYTPIDTYGLQFCDLYINGVYNDTDNSVDNGVQNNFTKTFVGGEQRVYWYINCTNDDGLWSVSDTWTFSIDLTDPTVVLNYPDDDLINNETVIFNFTVSDNNATTLWCDLYIDGTLNETGIEADNGIPELVTVNGFVAGTYSWNVTCSDNATNSDWSGTNNFTIAFGPSVTLKTPVPNAVTSETDVMFNYTVESTADLVNCSLLLNGEVNQTKNASDIPNVGNGFDNNFTVSNIAEGRYNWTVLCFDNNSLNGTDTERGIHVDRTAPNVTLNAPDPGTNISLSTITFNFTAFDTVDDVLSCNFTVYNATGLYNSTDNISATMGIPTTTVQGGFVTGTYWWNVTCSDGLFTNRSATWNFTVSNIPQVILLSPDEPYYDADGFVEFSYRPETLATGWQYCSLIIDGAINDTEVVVINGVTNYFNYTNMTSGHHTWQINCTDLDNMNGSSEIRNFSIDLVDPSVTANSPKNTIENSTVTFNWTATDDLDLNLSCDLSVNGTIYSTWAENGTPRLYNVSGLDDGFYLWNVTCADDAGRTNTSSTENFTVAEIPRVTLNAPADGYRNSTTTRTLYYTPTDNSGALANCSLYLNGAFNQTNATPVTESALNNFTVTGVVNGTYTWTVNCTDEHGNTGNNTSPWTFYVDLQAPWINQTEPPEGETFNQDDITFNWTAIDFPGSTITCDLWIDGAENVSGLQELSPASFNATVSNLTDGDHNWSVNCSDDLGNWVMSGTRNFTINQPDLYVDDSRVWVNESNPDLYENITITANVSNIGGRDATNALVEFWDGNPFSGGTLIGNDTATVLVNDSVLFTVTWNITPGYHTIYVLVDPNGTIPELNETNNNATFTISVLWANITAPGNNTYTNLENTTINFTTRDYTAGAIDYTILVDGVPAATGSTTDGLATLDNVTLTEGNRSIVVRVNDSLGRIKDSPTIYRIYDATPPTVNFETLNGTFFDDTTPPITFNFSDALSTIINYTVFVDGVPDQSNTTTIDTSVNVNLSAIGEGAHNVTVQGTDQAGNKRNSTLLIYVDQNAPTATLLYPGDNANFSTRTVELNFTVTDTVDPLLQCNLTLDGSVIGRNLNVTDGSTSSTTVNDLAEGAHTWNVTCWDGNNDVYQVLHTDVSETWTFNIYFPPNVTLIWPHDGNMTGNENVTFYFNVSDETGLTNCSLYLNGVWNATKTTAQLTNNATNNFTVNNLYGFYEWNVSCWDNASTMSEGWSQTWNITVDTIAPYPVFETLNETWFSTSTPTVFFNITDDFDNAIFYTIYADGAENTNGTAPEGSSFSDTLVALADGAHTLIIEAVDDVGNKRNSTSIVIYVDTVEPNIQLLVPPNGNETNGSTVTFNWTVTDAMDDYLNCTLTVSGEPDVDIIVQNNTIANYTHVGLTSGLHYWNVTCYDEAGNTNTSATWNFTVPLPDLVITAGNITFNVTGPVEGDNITINATVFNLGNTDSPGTVVQFWLGDPDGAGVKIGLNQSVGVLAPGANATVGVNYTVQIGPNVIYVVVDPPTATNGFIIESNETNNKAFRSLFIGFYHYFAGNTTNKLRVADAVYEPVWTWNVTNATGSNVIIADTDSVLDFTAFQALNRDTSNNPQFDDFAELDTQLGASSFNDNINTTWTSASAPRETRSYTLFTNPIANVPVVNSTNVSSFKTGILWDTSDGGVEYTGAQDVVFITTINESTLGSHGIYDFEARVPAPLRDYTGVTSSVTFYVELT